MPNTATGQSNIDAGRKAVEFQQAQALERKRLLDENFNKNQEFNPLVGQTEYGGIEKPNEPEEGEGEMEESPEGEMEDDNQAPDEKGARVPGEQPEEGMAGEEQTTTAAQQKQQQVSQLLARRTQLRGQINSIRSFDPKIALKLLPLKASIAISKIADRLRCLATRVGKLFVSGVVGSETIIIAIFAIFAIIGVVLLTLCGLTCRRPSMMTKQIQKRHDMLKTKLQDQKTEHLKRQILEISKKIHKLGRE